MNARGVGEQNNNMKYSEISSDLKQFIRTLWNRANQDDLGNPIKHQNSNGKHNEIHTALDSLGLSRGTERGDFLNSLND